MVWSCCVPGDLREDSFSGGVSDIGKFNSISRIKNLASYGSAVVENSTTDCDIKGSNPGKETGLG
jgi:hypothetical protein